MYLRSRLGDKNFQLIVFIHKIGISFQRNLLAMEIFTFWFSGCCAYGLCMITSAETHHVAQQGMLSNDAAYESEPVERNVRKRAITRAVKGMAAVEKLLTGATKVATLSKKYRLYKKNGDIDSAIRDFYSVGTMLTQNMPNLFTARRRTILIIRTVGDRRLHLMPYGDRYSRHSPVLEIRSDRTDAYDYRIVYRTKGD